MSTYSVDTTITSTAVASVNQTGEAMFGRAFVTREVYGYGVQTPTIVTTGSTTATVNVVAHTAAHPQG